MAGSTEQPKYWLVMVMADFSRSLSIQTAGGLVPARLEGSAMVGYAPIYGSREAAEADWPGKTILPLQEAS